MKKTPHLLPAHRRLLSGLGENLRLARLRRKLSATQVAERAGISRRTLVSIESGEPTVAMGNYFQVLRVLGLERDFQLLARDDEMGRKLQDLELTPKRRALNESPHHEPSVCDKVFFDEAAARSNAFEYIEVSYNRFRKHSCGHRSEKAEHLKERKIRMKKRRRTTEQIIRIHTE